MEKKREISKKGQIWIETVIYTLIALVMIGLVLSYVKPKIEDIRDEAVITNSINLLEDVNNVVLAIRGVPGNQRLLEMSIKKGVFEIDSENDKLNFEIESRKAYSQPGSDVNYGSIIAHTEKKGRNHILILSVDYSDEYNVTYKEQDLPKSLTKSSTPYKVLLSNKGINNDRIAIDIETI